MRIAVAAGAVLAFGLTFGAAEAAKAPAKHAAKHAAAAKAAPSCGALAFRALAGTNTDGEQTAGTYKSRLARLELKASVQGGAPTNYYLVANGRPMSAAAKSVPEAAASCAAAKKMPPAQAAASACAGDRFTLVVARAGNDRYGLLYGHDASAGAWKFCTAGNF